MRPVLIAGPTASGKSALALALAERDGGCVINADALQVYACWRILTARPDAADCARAPHTLYGHVDCRDRYSVGAWLHDAAAALEDARKRGLRPIFTGGTGLYFAALIEGLAQVPAIPEEFRARSDHLLAGGRLAEMAADLARDDPETWAVIDRDNPRRVQRAWEVRTATGRGLAQWRRSGAPPILPANEAVKICLWPDKDSLNCNIEARNDMMLEHGALAECAAYRAAGLDPAAPAGRALGAAPLLAHLDGRTTLAEAAAATVTATRRYAKRQRTWFRGRMNDWTRVDPASGDALAIIPRH